MNYSRTAPNDIVINIGLSEFQAMVLRDFLAAHTNPASGELAVYHRLAKLHNCDMEEINAALVSAEELLETETLIE